MPATVAVEGLLWLVALVVYVRVTRASRRLGVYVFWAMIAFFSLAWINNITAMPPAGITLTAEAISSLTFFTVLVAVWAYWMDRVRKPAY